ncbi:MAG TPA: carboxypeptidase-like regulatory domain-containing protein, partial [Verrucomicrobiae bacterium]|nr:carboxypeptidase-like regulatory domain-containing protein [Verrucomicrobiae bacterium]
MKALIRDVRLRKLLVALLGIALLPLGASAQTYRGTILGTVTDPSGAVVPGAKVTVRNVNTGLIRETETAADGSYSIPELPIGTYAVTVEMAGFQTVVTSGVRVEVAGERRVDAALRPGDVAQRIEVTGETIAEVQTTSDVLGGAFEGKMVLDLPINGRDYTKLLTMVPGAAGEPNGGGDSPGSYGLFSVNGNRGRSNNFLLDGTDMNDGFRNLPAINQGGVFGTPGTVLPVEVIAELRVLSSFEAEFGRNSGSVVNIVTKSGTNDFHGSVFDYFRHDRLNARNFFNVEPNPKDKFRNNQFGVAVGGPIVKDRAFFYVAYEGQRERLGVTSVNTVPSQADFDNAILNLGGNPATPVAQNPVVNPVIQNLFSLCSSKGGCSGGNNVWPAANLTGSPNSVSSAPAFNDADSFIVKLDDNISERHQLSGRYFISQSDQSFPLGTGGGNNLPATNTFSPIKTQLVSISHVWAASNTQVNEFRFGWVRYEQDFLAGDREVFGNPASTLMLNTGVTNERDFGLPTIRVSGFASLGSAPYSNPRGRRDTNWHVIDNFSWKRNRHDLKFGYEYRRTDIKSFYDTNFRGVLNFDSLEDFLAGNVGSGVLATGNADRRTSQNSHAFYL